MLKEERFSTILDQLKQRKKVLTAELSQVLEVSEDTIRRDLKELSDNGHLRKVHGGAIASSLNPFNYRDREVYALEHKITIAEKTIPLLSDSKVIIMDGGTTNLELAKRFPEDMHATIFTNSLPVAVQLSGHPTIEIIFAGGKLLKSAQATIGLEVIETFQAIRADLCILGTRSVNQGAGITEIDWEEAKVKRAIVQSAARVFSMTISEKLESLYAYNVAEIGRVDTLITELDPSNALLGPYKELGIHVY